MAQFMTFYESVNLNYYSYIKCSLVPTLMVTLFLTLQR